MTAMRTQTDAQHAVGGGEGACTAHYRRRSAAVQAPSLACARAGLRLSLYTVWMSCQCVQGILATTKTHTLLKLTDGGAYTHTCCQQGWLSIKEVFYSCINWLQNEL